MPRVSIRQLRDTRTLKEWLRAGLSIELTDREKVIARIVPEHRTYSTAASPDFLSRQKEIFGDRKFPAALDLFEERSRF